MTDARPATTTPSTGTDASTGQLLAQFTAQTSELVRSELRLAQVEMTDKAKHAGLGAGMFGGAGLVALYGVAALLATVILALALVVPAWLAALIVTVVLFAVAGVTALVGKKQVQQATPAAPQQAIDGVQRDVDVLKGGSAR
jgi:uncharacterized membrane protein YqjE